MSWRTMRVGSLAHLPSSFRCSSSSPPVPIASCGVLAWLGMDSEAREASQSAWMRGRARICVATVAFGMGVDKADVTTIIHTAIPRSVEQYVQEVRDPARLMIDSPPAVVQLQHLHERPKHVVVAQSLAGACPLVTIAPCDGCHLCSVQRSDGALYADYRSCENSLPPPSPSFGMHAARHVQVGRAGRDGREAHCVALLDPADLRRNFNLNFKDSLSLGVVTELLQIIFNPELLGKVANSSRRSIS